jgi:hypothetical protein
MKSILIGAVFFGGVVALVLLAFSSGSDGDVADSGLVAATATVVPTSDVVEIPNEDEDPNNPGSNFSGSGSSPFDGISRGSIDPQFLIAQLEAAGVEIPDGATTEELAELLDEAVREGGFIGFAP